MPLARLSGPAALLFAVTMWGLAPVISRYLITVAHLGPVPILLVRFTLAGLVFLPVLVRLRPDRWTWGDLARGAAAGLSGIFGLNTAITHGLQWVPAATGGLLTATEPLWIVLLSTLVLRERFTRHLAVGAALALAGVATLTNWGAVTDTSNPLFLAGFLLILFGAFLWGVYVVVARPLVQRRGAWPAAACALVVGALPLQVFWGPESAGALARLDPSPLAALLGLTLGANLLGFPAWNFGASRVPAIEAGLFLYVMPIVSVLGARLVLGEALTLQTLAGSLLILVGVAVAQFWPLMIRRWRGDLALA